MESAERMVRDNEHHAGNGAEIRTVYSGKRDVTVASMIAESKLRPREFDLIDSP